VARRTIVYRDRVLIRARLYVTREPTQTLAALVLVIDTSSGHGSEHLPER